MRPNKILYTTGEAVIQLRKLISQSTISRYFDRGILKGEKNPINGRRMITKESIKRLLKKYGAEELNEVYEPGKGILPVCAAREVARAILELRKGFFKQQGLHVKDEGDGPWWCDPKIFDEEGETGPYFQFETDQSFHKSKWEWLLSNDPDDTARLILYVETNSIKKKAAKIKYIRRWVNALIKNKNKLYKKGIFLEEDVDYHHPYLVYRPLQEVNIELVTDRELFHKRIQQAVREFTSALLPILRKGIKGRLKRLQFG